jgi:hypothetical protein
VLQRNKQVQAASMCGRCRERVGLLTRTGAAAAGTTCVAAHQPLPQPPTQFTRYPPWALQARRCAYNPPPHPPPTPHPSTLRTAGQTLDLQESFLLSETLKYLHLLFSDAGAHLVDYFVLSTEGHPLPTFAGPDEEEDAQQQQERQQAAGSAAEPAAGRQQGADAATAPAADAAEAPAAQQQAPAGPPVPRNCRRICLPRSPAELAAAERALGAALPLAPVRREDALRIRTRRCQACVAVAEALAQQPVVSAAERVQQLNLGVVPAAAGSRRGRGGSGGDDGGGVLVGQVACEVQLLRGGKLRCHGLRALDPLQLFVGLAPTTVVLQLHQAAAGSGAGGGAGRGSKVPPVPPHSLLVSVETEEGPLVMRMDAGEDGLRAGAVCMDAGG